MTSNIGITDLNRQASDFGFSMERSKDLLEDARKKAETEYDRVKDNVIRSLKETMRPELLNRIDKILVFHPLAMEEIRKIVVLELSKLADHVKKQQNINLIFDREITKHIAEKSYDPNQGARLIRRNIQELIEDPLAEKIISGEVNENTDVKLSVDQGYVTIRQVDLAKV